MRASAVAGLLVIVLCVGVLAFIISARQPTYSLCEPIAQDYRLGLVGYWPLNEGIGNTAHDLSVYGASGNLKNAFFTSIQCPFSYYCVKFLGSTLQSNVTTTNNLMENQNHSFTLSAWIESFDATTGAGGGHWQIFMAKATNGGGPPTNYEFGLYGGGRLSFDYYTSTHFEQILTSNQVIFTNKSYFVSATILNQTSDNLISLYVNGSLVYSQTTTIGLSIENNNPLLIGQEPQSTGQTGFGFNGTLSEIRIYNFAFSAQQESNQYQWYENILNGV